MPQYDHGTLRGHVFSAEAEGGIANNGNVPFLIFNAFGTGVNCVLLKASLAYVSGGAFPDTAGSVSLFGATGGTAPSGLGLTLAPITPALLGNTLGATAKILVYKNVRASGGVKLRPLWSINSERDSTARQPTSLDVDLSGEFVLAPGAGAWFQSSNLPSALQAFNLAFGLTWAEVPVEEAPVRDQLLGDLTTPEEADATGRS